MRMKPPISKAPAEQVVKDIRRATRKHYSAEDEISIVLDGLRGENGIVELCQPEGIAQGQYYSWSKEFLEAGKRRLAGNTVRAETPHEVKSLGREGQRLQRDRDRPHALEPPAQKSINLLPDNFPRLTR